MANETQPLKQGADLSGQTIGDYYLHRKLGEGGMGQVYLADQLALRRRVALKLLRSDAADNETSRKRFEAEARAVAQLTHANVVQVYDFGLAAGQWFMALEFVDGRNLREYVERKGPPELPLALSIMKQAAAALQRAAELGIIHRDVKPENLLLTRRGEVKVTDFGLSRMIADGQPAQHLTQTGVTMGTPLYMSPEQVEGRPLDHRTDVYSLGVTFYYLLAGEPPFKGENAFAVACQHVTAEPPSLAALRPDLPPELIAIVHRMIQKKPEQRYASAGDVLRDLKRLSAQLNGGLASDGPSPSISLPNFPSMTLDVDVPLGPTVALPNPNRRRWQLALAVAMSLLLAAVGGAALAYGFRPPPEHDHEQADQLDAANPLLDAALGDYKQKEKALRTLIEITESPGKERDDAQRGLAHRLDLAVLYLDRQPRELAKAEALFKKQSASKVPEYALFGKLGEAMVLAFQDETDESIKRFLELNRPGARIEVLQPSRYPRFARLVADALYANRRNCEPKSKYPAALVTMEQAMLRGAPRLGPNLPTGPGPVIPNVPGKLPPGSS